MADEKPEEKVLVVENEKSIVEKVFAEPNLMVHNNLPPMTAPVVYENEMGKVRIEGEVTDTKLALARQFHELFAGATQEIEELAVYEPRADIQDLVDSGEMNDSKLAQIRSAKPLSVFKVGGKYLVKTPDNKLEEVKDYCFRLERAVIAQIGIRKQSEEKSNNSMKFLQEQLDIALRQNEAYEKHLSGLKDKVMANLPQVFDAPKRKTALWLKLKPHFAKIKIVLIQLLSEEHTNG